MVSSEWNLLRLSTERRYVWPLIFLRAVQLANRIRLHLPSLERHGALALSLAKRLLIGAAHERALDVDVIALVQLTRGVFAEAVPRDDAMPLRLGVPFFVGTFPGPLSRQRKNRVLAVCRLDGLVLRALAEITDEMNSVLVHFVSPFLPL